MTRRDYYNFTHYLLPHTVFKFPEMTISNILGDKEKFAETLKVVWKTIELEDNVERSIAPSFSFGIEKISDNTNLIILNIPEATEFLEAPFVGIVFDKKFNVRYFTYEINKQDNKECYFLCEWEKEWRHVNYSSYDNRNVKTFLNEIKHIINL